MGDLLNYPVRSQDVCFFCNNLLGSAKDSGLALIEFGAMQPMVKDPEYLQFAPNNKKDYDIVHDDCLISRLPNTVASIPLYCNICSRRFLIDIPKWAYRMRLGYKDTLTGMFVVHVHLHNEAIVCPDCIANMAEQQPKAALR